jgi:hypothetical protein
MPQENGGAVRHPAIAIARQAQNPTIRISDMTPPCDQGGLGLGWRVSVKSSAGIYSAIGIIVKYVRQQSTFIEPLIALTVPAIAFLAGKLCPIVMHLLPHKRKKRAPAISHFLFVKPLIRCDLRREANARKARAIIGRHVSCECTAAP